MKKLTEIDMVKLAESAKDFLLEKEKEKEALKSFWKEDLCKKMIEDMKLINKGFDIEEFSYFPEKVKARFGWDNISDNDIKKFIDVMAEPNIGVVKKDDIKEDEDCSFENYRFIKEGIVVFIMYGQGTFISFTPQ